MKKLLLIMLVSSSAFAESDFNLQQTSFKELFNANGRIGQPDPTPWAGSYFPYSDNGTAVLLDGAGNVTRSSGVSPLSKFDVFAGLKDTPRSSEKWEKATHTCEGLKDSELAACRGWYGHCNGWDAAAIRETEPKKENKNGSESQRQVVQDNALLGAVLGFHQRKGQDKVRPAWPAREN